MRTLKEIEDELYAPQVSGDDDKRLRNERDAFTREVVDSAILQAVKDHALAHYAEGWDPIVEAYEPWELADAIKGCTSVQNAIGRLAETLDLRAEVCHDVRSAGDIVEPAPKPVPRGLDCGTSGDTRWEDGR